MRRFALATVLAMLTFFAFTSPASAQVVNPTAVEFDASADHNAVVLTTPVVTNYELRIFKQTTPTVVDKRLNLAKPTPVAGKIIVINKAFFDSLTVGEYIAKVAAIGPAGEGESTATAPFGRMTAPAAPGTAPVLRVTVP